MRELLISQINQILLAELEKDQAIDVDSLAATLHSTFPQFTLHEIAETNMAEIAEVGGGASSSRIGRSTLQ
jgi:hypothetical protein